MTSSLNSEKPREVNVDGDQPLIDSDLDSLSSHGDDTILWNPSNAPIQRKELNDAGFWKRMETRGKEDGCDNFVNYFERYRSKVKGAKRLLEKEIQHLNAPGKQLGDTHVISPKASGDVDKIEHDWPQLLEALKFYFDKILTKNASLIKGLQEGHGEHRAKEFVETHHHIYCLVKEFEKLSNRLKELNHSLYGPGWKKEFLGLWEKADEEFCALHSTSNLKLTPDESDESHAPDDNESVQTFHTAPTTPTDDTVVMDGTIQQTTTASGMSRFLSSQDWIPSIIEDLRDTVGKLSLPLSRSTAGSSNKSTQEST
ncbi:hypothetical protein QFC19_001805 [Naganishia cerealis]|uniref:Uncharacterized protein n=1 Tax=Naganishia cerealis TaxID=610337 RepID=A0ACC2WFZ1_9TREE|nr:hypothetical protein QFC19_001805 [Naganishia cerealis]